MNEEVATVPCPHCGMEYQPGPGMTRHIEAAHPEQEAEREPGPGEVACEHCGKVLKEGSLGRHMRAQHDIRRRRGRPKNGNGVTPHVSKPKEAKLPALTADQIAEAAAGALFPTGVPHSKLRPLLRWTLQTHEFLQEVQ